MVNGLKHCWNLHDTTLNIFIDQCERKWAGKILLGICKALGLFVNTLTADGKYSLLNRDSLTKPIQMQLSKNQKGFQVNAILVHFEKNWLQNCPSDF